MSNKGTMTGALKAILARIDGVFDEPNLQKFGHLRVSALRDVHQIAREALDSNMEVGGPTTVVKELDEENERLRAANMRLRIRQEKLWDALHEIEAHHVEQNALKGRPESASKTLRIIRDAL